MSGPPSCTFSSWVQQHLQRLISIYSPPDSQPLPSLPIYFPRISKVLEHNKVRIPFKGEFVRKFASDRIEHRQQVAVPPRSLADAVPLAVSPRDVIFLSVITFERCVTVLYSTRSNFCSYIAKTKILKLRLIDSWFYLIFLSDLFCYKNLCSSNRILSLKISSWNQVASFCSLSFSLLLLKFLMK